MCFIFLLLGFCKIFHRSTSCMSEFYIKRVGVKWSCLSVTMRLRKWKDISFINIKNVVICLIEEYYDQVFVPVAERKQTGCKESVSVFSSQMKGTFKIYFVTRLWTHFTFFTNSTVWGAHTWVAYPKCERTREKYSVRRIANSRIFNVELLI